MDESLRVLPQPFPSSKKKKKKKMKFEFKFLLILSSILFVQLINCYYCDLSAYNNSPSPANQALQNCINASPTNDILEVPQGNYVISNQLI